MPRAEWEKQRGEKEEYEGPRGVDLEGLFDLDSESFEKVQLILNAMAWPQLIVFYYDGSDRIVAPFVVGVSKEGNPLLRGYQLEGFSRSGKGAGWRVFQIRKMERLDNQQEFFNAEDFDFDEYYPWIYKVFKML